VSNFFAQNLDEGVMLKETTNYQIGKFFDPATQSDYIEMWGYLESSGDYAIIFIMRSPLESIRDSVAVSIRFFSYVGLIIILFSIILVWYFVQKILNPIWELALLSQKMANLDFETKYLSGGNNEIGILGDSFNKLSEKLERSISELKNANYELKKDIEQKVKSEAMRTEFIGNVSHELKTPIALIQGYAEGLMEEINHDTESKEFYCEVIVDEAAKMNRMVKSLLELNQLEAGSDGMQFERINLTEMIQGILLSSDILIQQKQVTVHFREQKAIYAWADEWKVEQVLRNYLQNALNHVENEKIIEIKIHQMDAQIRVTVFNTGRAIPEADIERIWDKFYKVDKARTREYGGNGIGLSIVKAIMDALNQQYGVKNYDNGVEFWFELDVK